MGELDTLSPKCYTVNVLQPEFNVQQKTWSAVTKFYNLKNIETGRKIWFKLNTSMEGLTQLHRIFTICLTSKQGVTIYLVVHNSVQVFLPCHAFQNIPDKPALTGGSERGSDSSHG